MRRFLVLSTAIAAMSAAPAFAEPTLADLQREVDQLKAQLNQRNTSADVDRVVSDVLKDANHRSALLASEGALTAGYDKSFFIKSEDGNYVLRPHLWWQFRYVANHRDDPDDTQDGFENRRTWLRFDGNVFTPDLTYCFVWETARSGGGVSLLDAYGQYRFADQWAVKFGQFRESFSLERNNSCFETEAVDRSIVDAVLGGQLVDRVQGASLIYGEKSLPFRAEVTASDGANSKNTNFENPPTNPTDWGAAARVEYKIMGDWVSYKDFTAKGTKEDLLVIGAGVDGTERSGSMTYLTTADIEYENPNGLSAFAAIHCNFTELRNVAGDDSRFDYGAVGQVGYAFSGNWEVFGRVSYICLDDDFVADSTFSEYEAGVTYFFGQNGALMHRAKVQFDIGYLPDGAPSDQTGLGIFASNDTEIVLRGQFQLLL